MLKNTNGSKRGLATIPDGVWTNRRLAAYQDIQDKLKASRTLLEAVGSTEIAAGLYMYAFEEYGKFLILQKAHEIVIGFAMKANE